MTGRFWVELYRFSLLRIFCSQIIHQVCRNYPFFFVYCRKYKFQTRDHKRGIFHYNCPVHLLVLILKYPNNPYFYELKAQILRENGYLNNALKNYSKAIEIIPNDGLILIELAQTQINFETNKYLNKAIKNLKTASLQENENQKLWYLLSVAYGRNNELGKSRYASAYSAYLKGDNTLALSFIAKARKILKPKSFEWYQLEDLESRIKSKK